MCLTIAGSLQSRLIFRRSKYVMRTLSELVRVNWRSCQPPGTGGVLRVDRGIFKIIYVNMRFLLASRYIYRVAGCREPGSLALRHSVPINSSVPIK